MTEFVIVNEQDEVKKLSDIATSIVRDYYDPIIGEAQNTYMIEKFQSVEGLNRQLEAGYEFYFIKCDNDIKGFISIKYEEEKLFLSKFYIHKDSRGKGFGRDSINFLCEKAKNHNKKSIYLTVNRFNYNSIEVYKHFGFKIVEERKTDIGQGYVMDDYILEYEV